ESVHEQSDAGVKSGLGELDGAYVVLSDRQCLRALIDDIAKRAALRHDARTACGELSIDHTVLTDDAREEHLGNHFDDARAADPRDAGGLHGFLEPRLVGPQVGADDLEARLERRRVDPYALDRARRGALATADLCTLERRAGRARAGEQALPVAQHDLGVGADIDEQRNFLAKVGPLGQYHTGCVSSDMAGYAGQRVRPRTAVQVQADLRGPKLQGFVGREREGRASELHRVDAEQQVMHDRVADQRDLENVVGVG